VAAYGVVLLPRAQRELDRVPHEAFGKIDTAIRGLAENPRPFGVQKLQGELHRIRVGDWRVLYAIFDNDDRVVILRVARRSGKTYKYLS
jgi:mRNA interferase RelE/StbE